MDKITYIGIGGHKGSGRTTFAYILSNTIYWQRCNWNSLENNIVKYKNMYLDYISNIIRIVLKDPDTMKNFDTCKYIHVSSFSDMMKYYISFIIGADFKWLSSDNNKDKLFINLRTLEINNHYTGELIYIEDICNEDFTDTEMPNRWMIIEDFYTYFAKYIFNRHLGENIWIKLLDLEDARDKQYSTYKYKIYYGIKRKNELDFIKNKEGYTIYLNRPDNQKYSKINIIDPNEYDKIVEINGDIMSIIDNVWDIALKLNELNEK